MNLLSNLRSISSIIDNHHSDENFLEKICNQLSNLTLSNVYVYDYKQNIIGYSVHKNYYCKYNEEFLSSYSMPQEYMELTKNLSKPILNNFEYKPNCTNPKINNCIFDNRYTSLVPIYYSSKKVGAILLIKYNKPFSVEDEILCEHTYAIISLEFARKEIDRIQSNSRDLVAANIAFNTLSYSEELAYKEIFSMINNGDGIIVASEVADKLFLTRSTVNNTLKKLESAGIIQIRSLGAKGTYIKIINKYILDFS